MDHSNDQAAPQSGLPNTAPASSDSSRAPSDTCAFPALDAAPSATQSALDGLQRLGEVVAQAQRELDAARRVAAELDSRELNLATLAATLASKELEISQREIAAKTVEDLLRQRAEAIEKREAEATTRDTELIARSSRLDNHEHALAERELALHHQQRQIADDSQKVDPREAEAVDRAESEARAALAQCAHLARELEALRTAHRPGGESPTPASFDHDAASRTRRARLKLQRALLSHKAEQLIRAKALIEQRQAELASSTPPAVQPTASADVAQREAALQAREAQLNQRLIEAERARAALDDREKLAARTEAELNHRREALSLQAAAFTPDEHEPLRTSRSHRPMNRLVAAGLSALCVSASAACVAGLSWWAAGVFDQPVFIAQTRIAMESAPESATEASESWSVFHEELTTDPRLLELAAERFKRRGYADLATPADLRARLEADLTIESSSPGTMSLALRGVDRLRTQRTLDTYAAALITASNDTRDRRLDGASTSVIEQAATGDSPVSSERIHLFTMIAAALVALTFIRLLAGAATSRPSAPRRPEQHRATTNPKKETAAPLKSGGEGSWTVPVE